MQTNRVRNFKFGVQSCAVVYGRGCRVFGSRSLGRKDVAEICKIKESQVGPRMVPETLNPKPADLNPSSEHLTRTP